MVIVVEGKNDANKIRSVYKNAQIVITNGSELSENTINLLERLSVNNEIVLCLDPDGPGEKIRKLITNRIPNASHVFVEKSKAISRNKKKVGIEHMSVANIAAAFANKKIVCNSGTITMMDLYNLGYVESASKRHKLCSELNISFCNNKQLLKRINMFGITLEELEKYDC